MVKLIDDIKDWRKFWSVKLAFIGGALLSLAEMGPSWVASVWEQFPIAFQEAVPDTVVKWIGIGFVFASPIARAIKQRKLDAEKTN